MDVSEQGQLRRIAAGLGTIIATSTSGEAGEVDARAFHVARAGQPHVVVAGSVASGVVLAMLTDTEGAASAMAAARVLVHERGDVVRPGLVVTLRAGASGARSVRGSTGAFAIVSAATAELPSSVDVLAVHAFPPLSEWERASLEEVQQVVPDLVSRFRPPKPRGAKAAPPKRVSSAPSTIVRRRPKE
jgi:hypothetical protein